MEQTSTCKQSAQNMRARGWSSVSRRQLRDVRANSLVPIHDGGLKPKKFLYAVAYKSFFSFSAVRKGWSEGGLRSVFFRGRAYFFWRQLPCRRSYCKLSNTKKTKSVLLIFSNKPGNFKPVIKWLKSFEQMIKKKGIIRFSEEPVHVS